MRSSSWVTFAVIVCRLDDNVVPIYFVCVGGGGGIIVRTQDSNAL
jgi:hypothetical protein